MVDKAGVEIKLHQKYFDEKGEKVPSVTQGLSVINIPALPYVAWKLGTQGIDFRVDWKDKASIGTLVHRMSFARDTKTKVDYEFYTQRQIDLAGICFGKYLNWESQHTIKIIKLECSSVSERYGFGGTFDKLCILDGVPTLIDYKSGKAFYRNMYYQIAAYRHLVSENKLGKVKDCLVLRFGRKESEDFDAHTATKEEIKLAWKIFLVALDLYKRTNQFDKM